MAGMNRRKFIHKGTRALAWGWFANRIYPLKAFAQSTASEGTVPLEYRTLGKTGLKATAIGYGAMRTSDPAVLAKALDMGINFVDTAHVYQSGNNEKLVGKVLKGRRDKVILCTKIKPNDLKTMAADFETSLKRLQTDYVDILYLHSLKEKKALYHPAALELFPKLKKEGKIRFFGFSTHKNEAQLLTQAAEDKSWDVIQTAYNFKKDHALTKAIQKASDAGIGVVCMKTQAGGYETKAMRGLSPHQAALKWVLNNPGVSTAIPGVTAFSQLEENIGAMGKTLGQHDKHILHRYSQSITPHYCRACGACLDSCHQGVDIAEVNRCLMYYEGYGDWPLAHQSYLELLPEERADKCRSCDLCQARCKYGINLSERMPSVHSLLV